MSIICFLRHGQTDWNVKGLMQGIEEIPLNETGIMQAKQASSELANALDGKDFKFDRIYTSPLSRARVTAQEFAKKLGDIPVIVDKRLIERDFGILSGKTYDKNSKAVLQDMTEPSVETAKSLIDRVNSLIKDEVKNNENVIFVTHGAITRIYAKNAKKAQSVSEIDIGIIGNCALVAYKYDGNESELIGYDIPTADFNVEEL